MERRLKIGAGSGTSSTLFKERALKLKAGQPLTTSVNKGSKLLNVGKKVFSKTPIGRAVNLAINVGSGIGIGYSYAKNKFNKKKADFQKGDYSDIKTDKKMGGGMMQGYGAARTSGMGLEDQSLPPGQMVKARFGDFMNTFIADDKRSVAGKSGGADSGTAGEMRSKLGKSDVVEKKKIKNYIKKKVEQGKTVIKKTKEAAKKTGTILATPIKKFHEAAEENVRKNGPVRIFKRSYSKGGGMDMGKKEEPTQWITKKEKPKKWITKKEK